MKSDLKYIMGPKYLQDVIWI